jgi:hypothetical protein
MISLPRDVSPMKKVLNRSSIIVNYSLFNAFTGLDCAARIDR